MRPLEKVLDRVEGVEKRPNGFWALCPAHDDRNTPNLHVTESEDGSALLHCFAGCSQAEILAALQERGLQPRDLFAGGDVVPLRNDRSKDARGSRSGHERLVASWRIKDHSGRVAAIHERLEGTSGKRFRWKHPDGRISKRGEIKTAALPLYGSERVGDWPEDRGIILVEGEKAADALLELGIRALATVTGSSTIPDRGPLEVLTDRRVILWPDDDRSGREHMQRVAGSLQGIAAEVRWFEWEGPADVTGPDAADHPAVASKDRSGIRELAEQLASAPAWEPSETASPPEPPGLPQIQVNNRHLRDVTSDALAALVERNEPPEVFVRSGALVRVREDENGIPQIQAMHDGHVRGRLARVADFVRVTEKGETRVSPPEVVVKDLQALAGWGLPALEAVVESPILRPDGTIFDTPGYDPQTRLVYRPARGFEPPQIPAEPTPEDVRRAVELIDEAVGEFPYEDGSSAANTLALMLTPLVRQAIEGPVPMALIDKPQAGTGGSLLAEAVAIIGTGRGAEMLGAPREDEEWRKQITAKLSSGATMITVDNVEHPLYAPSLARALTARTWTDRVLGRSESITLAQRATWLATGNNIILRGDLPRRCYWIRLDAKKARPWQRGGFRHPDLLRWVSENRGALVRALLIIARAWFAAGRPSAAGVPRLGSFEAWAETVGGMVAFAGIPGFLGNLEALYEKADEGGAEWEAFLSAWWAACGEEPATVAELAEKIKDDEELRATLPPDLAEVLDKGQGSFSRRLGKALSSRAGTRYGEDELHVVKAGEKKRAVRWRIQKGSPEGEFTSLVSLYNPSASKNYAYNAGKNGENRSEGAEINSRNSQTHHDPEAWAPDPGEDHEDLRGGLQDPFKEDR